MIGQLDRTDPWRRQWVADSPSYPGPVLGGRATTGRYVWFATHKQTRAPSQALFPFSHAPSILAIFPTPFVPITPSTKRHVLIIQFAGFSWPFFVLICETIYPNQQASRGFWKSLNFFFLPLPSFLCIRVHSRHTHTHPRRATHALDAAMPNLLYRLLTTHHPRIHAPPVALGPCPVLLIAVKSEQNDAALVVLQPTRQWPVTESTRICLGS